MIPSFWICWRKPSLRTDFGVGKMTNAERLIAVLRTRPGLDDDELSAASGVRPRQAVNAECRHLERRGIVRRTIGARGKIVNHLTENLAPSPVVARSATEPGTPPKPPAQSNRVRSESSHSVLGKWPTPSPESALIILPCSGRKQPWPGRRERGVSILDLLPASLADRLLAARRAIAPQARLDESTLVPAWQRYSGTLYQAASPALTEVFAARPDLSVIIISGGYGLVLATEPIGCYEAVFRHRSWPRGLLEEIIVASCERLKTETVLAFLSGSTDYRRVVEATPWQRSTVTSVRLLSPEATPGAMVKAPRAQGEALAASLQGKLGSDWTSSDGLKLIASKLK